MHVILTNDPDCVKTISIFQKWIKYAEEEHKFMVISHFMPFITMLVGSFFVSCPNFRVFTQSGAFLRTILLKFYDHIELGKL